MNKTDDIKRQVLEEYENGSKATDLSKKYGISRGTIYLWIDNKRKGLLTFDPEKKNEVLRLYKEENWTPKQLSEKFGVSLPTIYEWVRTDRINTKNNGVVDKVLQLYKEEHKTPEEISSETGVVLDIVKNWIRNSGLELTEEQMKEVEPKQPSGSLLEQIQNLREKNLELEEKIEGLEENNRYLREYISVLKKQLEQK